MKKINSFLLLAIIAVIPAFSQAEKVVGIWLTGEGTSQVKIYKATDGKYYGKIVWLEEPNNEDGTPKVDDQNPDIKLQNKPILNLLILKSFTYDEANKQWIDGRIYDPNNGKTYDCYMWFENDPKTLHIKGYVMGMRFLGRETAWKKEDKLRE